MSRISEQSKSRRTTPKSRGSTRPALGEAEANVTGTYRRTRSRARVLLPVQDGCVFVVSDQHYLPGDGDGKGSVAHRASLALAKTLRPWALINNGDAIDGASISRWPVGSFTEMKNRTTVAAELKEAAARLADYEAMDFVRFRIWNLGNHDARFETRLAEKAAEYADVAGFRLKDHFPGWLPAWRTDIVLPDDTKEVIIQHRFKGGMHAGQNNVLWSGTNYVTGHDHMLKAYSVTTTRGLFWGVHAGTMAPIDSPLFVHYTEDRPVNWQEGFPILWFRGGRFVGPELVHVTPDGRVLFRGEILTV